MIPPIVKAGLRVLAPDLIGFGKSDKLTRVSEYTYQGHLEWLLHWIEALEQELTLFCQDWGSFLGLRLAMEYEQRFCRIMVSNGFLPTVSNGFSPSNRSLVPWRNPSQMVSNPNSKRVSMECYSVSPVTQVGRGSIRVRSTLRARGHGPNRGDCETTLG
jgi:pimeloyl-ACP methyl ester carboxylesterase